MRNSAVSPLLTQVIARRRIYGKASVARSACTFVRRAYTGSAIAHEGMVGWAKIIRLSNWEERKVNIAQLLEDFRVLQCVEAIKNNAPMPQGRIEYRNAERIFYQLGQEKKLANHEVTLGEIAEALPNTQSRAWNVILSRVDGKIPFRLSSLSEEENVKAHFLRVSHIGKVFAERFWTLGARSVEDLLKDPARFNLTHAQTVSAKYFKDMEQFIPRSESDQIKTFLLDTAKEVDENLTGEILGSYRRGNPFSSDIDLILRHPSLTRSSSDADFKAYMERIVKSLGSKIVETTANGNKIYRGLFRLKQTGICRRLDISLSPYETYHYKLLGSTGDDILMKIMRRRAKDLKMFLNEEGLGDRIPGKGTAETFDPDTLVEANSEEDIFKALKLPYLKPDQRNYKHYSRIAEYARFKDAPRTA